MNKRNKRNVIDYPYYNHLVLKISCWSSGTRLNIDIDSQVFMHFTFILRVENETPINELIKIKK